jgi:hypothetical protein
MIEPHASYRFEDSIASYPKCHIPVRGSAAKTWCGIFRPHFGVVPKARRTACKLLVRRSIGVAWVHPEPRDGLIGFGLRAARWRPIRHQCRRLGNVS